MPMTRAGEPAVDVLTATARERLLKIANFRAVEVQQFFLQEILALPPDEQITDEAFRELSIKADAVFPAIALFEIVEPFFVAVAVRNLRDGVDGPSAHEMMEGYFAVLATEPAPSAGA